MPSVTIGTATGIIVSANSLRISVILYNEGGSTVYLGQTNSLSTATGLPVRFGGNWTEDSGGQKMYLGPYYGISEVSSDVRYWERERM